MSITPAIRRDSDGRRVLIVRPKPAGHGAKAAWKIRAFANIGSNRDDADGPSMSPRSLARAGMSSMTSIFRGQ